MGPFLILLVIIIMVVLIRCIRIVPQAHAYIVERLGAYQCTLSVGMHLIAPFIDKVSRKISLKEQVLDFKPQTVITKDNVTMKVDTIIYYNITDPKLFTYAVEQPLLALENLTATTLRNIIGSLELDETLTSRDIINDKMQATLDIATDPWGIKVKRVELKDIQPPHGILETMEKQMRAEREKRAVIAESEGERQSRINRAEGEKQEAIAKSEGERTRRINEADGRAQEILLIAQATANGLREIANAISASEGGKDAMNLRLAEQYITEFGKLAKINNTMIMPTDLANVSGFIKTATTVIEKAKEEIK